MQTLNQSDPDQLGQAVGAHQVRVKSPQVIKVQKRSAAFEKGLNLPAGAVKFHHHVVAGNGLRQGSEDAEVAGQERRDSRRGMSFSGGIPAQALAVAAGSFGGQGTKEESSQFASAEGFLASGYVDQTRCLILDVALPGMSGPQLQQEVKLRRRKIPIVFIMAQTDESIRPRLLEQGAVGFLLKPFSDTALFEAVSAALQMS